MPTLRNAGFVTRRLIRTAEDEPTFSETVLGDLRNDSDLARLADGAHAIVHLAGIAHTRLRSAEEEADANAINVDGTRRLVQAASAAGVRHFLFMSSAHVYKGQQGIDLSEDAPTDGDTPYGRMKLEAEEIVLQAATPDMRVTILRPCLTYGPGVRFNLQALMRAIRKGYYFHVRGADPVRSIASVDTVAAAIAHLVATQTNEAIFNVADKDPVHLEQWVNHLADLMQRKRPRVMPKTFIDFSATVGTGLRRVGLPAPITRDSLHKLTSSFSLNTERLASTGFRWPETRETVLREMISAEIISGASKGHRAI